MSDLGMQQIFWDKLKLLLDKGVRSYDQKNYLDLDLSFGTITSTDNSMIAWFGENHESEPRLLIKANKLPIEIEALVGFSREDCLKLSAYYHEKNIPIEILNKQCKSCLRSRDNSIFVRSCEVYRETFNQTNQLIAILDKELNLRYVNKTMLNYLDVTMNEIIGTPYWELSLWSHSTELQNKIVFSLEQMHLGNEIRFETTHKNKNGEIRDIDFVIRPVFDDNDDVDLMIAMGYDVTESKLAESTLKRTEKEMKLFFDYSVNGYYINRLNESIYIDPTTLNGIFGYVQRHEKIMTYNTAILQQIDIPATTFENTNIFELLKITREQSLELWREMVEQGHVQYQADIDIAGVRKILDCTFVPILESGNRYSGSFGIIIDKTNEVLQERKMIYLATKDSLTGTNNRRHFLERAWSAMHKLTSESAHPAVLMLDIDDFKNVNDTYGHDIGDKVLIEMTNVCEYILKDKGVFGRMGGEEFATFLHNDDGKAIDVAEELRAAIEALSVKTDLGNVTFTVSIGYTEVEKGHSMEDALKRADRGLYKAKRSGKNKVETILS